MTRMRRLMVVIVVVLGGCTQTTSEPPTTVETAPISTAAGTTTTTSLPVEYDDCSAPLVHFSALCETYGLIEDWHVDGPPDPGTLVAAAVEGLRGFSTDQTEPPPRTLFCAMPDPDFAVFCDELAARVESEAVPVGSAVEAALISMIGTGLDPFTFYIPPDQVGAFRSNGVVGGIGILMDATDAVGSRCVRVTAACPLRIVFVLEDNPGADAGLATDDIIVAIDGEPIDGLGFIEAGSRIAGDETGVVELTIDRSGKTLEVSITRDELMIPGVEVEIPLAGVGYLRIPDFEFDIPELVHDGLSVLSDERINTIVVDLRDNPGGFIDVVIDVLSEFVDGGVVLIETYGVETFEYEASAGGLATQERLVILVNQGTASAAEILSMGLRDRRDATIIGENTFGKNAIQIVFPLDNEGELHLAVSHWLSPNGATVVDGGLIPDVEADLPVGLGAEEAVRVALEAAG
jgi:carboxyl-terminal processing protease